MRKIIEDKKMYIFPITIETCEEGGFFASTPVVQGAHAEGETYAETLERLEDVIRIHLELRLKNGEDVPSPSFCRSIDQHE